MSSASLALGHRARPDRARIAAISTTIAFNLAVVVIATLPLAEIHLPSLHSPQPIPTIRLINAPPAVQPPPEIKLKPLPRAAPSLPLSHPVNIIAPVVVPSALTEPTAAPLPAAPAAATAIPRMAASPSRGTPIEASLAYRSAPLTYPAQALREHMHGTVLLQVLMDAEGKPVDVRVERGSGYAVLDRSARAQVLSSWRFEPAMLDGHAVAAWARVPVSFALQ